ncbi:MAG: DUF480 domain-containing protein [Oceanococcus sp.]
MSEVLLSAPQARVMGALVEKSLSTPQYYPMTVNALMAACNQKNCRHPLMQLTAGEVGSALLDLLDLDLVADERSSRVPRWRHRFKNQFLLKAETQAVLIALMLRGPQTLAELRSNTSNLGGPFELEVIEQAIEDLQDRGQPLIKLLGQKDQKGARYAHLLCGEDAIVEPLASTRSAPAASRLDELEQRIVRLEGQLTKLLGADGVPD